MTPAEKYGYRWCLEIPQEDRFEVLINASPVGMFPDTQSCPFSEKNRVGGAEVVSIPSRILFKLELIPGLPIWQRRVSRVPTIAILHSNRTGSLSCIPNFFRAD